MEGCSRLHSADALIKLFSAFALLGAVILADSPQGYGVIILLLSAAVRLSGLSWEKALGGVRQLKSFFLFIFLMNALFFEAEQPLWSWWILQLSVEGTAQGLQVILRVALALVIGNLLLSTTPPLELTRAVESLLFPLKYLGVPVQDVAMILGASLQFVLILAQEAELIRKAQVARGAQFESRKLTEKGRSLLPLVVPIFLAAFRRADELATAMEARGYRRNGRSVKFRKRKIIPADLLLLLTACLICWAERFI